MARATGCQRGKAWCTQLNRLPVPGLRHAESSQRRAGPGRRRLSTFADELSIEIGGGAAASLHPADHVLKLTSCAELDMTAW